MTVYKKGNDWFLTGYYEWCGGMNRPSWTHAEAELAASDWLNRQWLAEGLRGLDIHPLVIDAVRNGTGKRVYI